MMWKLLFFFFNPLYFLQLFQFHFFTIKVPLKNGQYSLLRFQKENFIKDPNNSFGLTILLLGI